MKRFLAAFFVLFLLPFIAFSSTKNTFIKLDKKEFKTVHLTFTPKVTLFLPADYKTSGKKYAVMYALDGQNLFNNKDSFSGEWQLDENIEYLQKQDLLDEIIVVAVHNTSRRMWDYTPTFADTEDFGAFGGDLPKFGKFLTGELKPYIDSHFPTHTDREHTGIMGSSLGGLSSFYLLGWYPQVFSRAGVISASFWWNNVGVLKDMKKMSFPADVKIYLDGGWKEGADESSMITYMRQVYRSLKKAGLQDFKNIFYYEDPKGTHSETFWAKRGKMPLLFLWGKYDAGIQSIDIELNPSILVQGKTSKIFFTAKQAHDMLFTLLSPALTITPSGTATYNKNTLLPLRPGTLQLVIKQGSRKTPYTMKIFPDIKGTIHRQIKISSIKAVKGISLNIQKLDGVETNVILSIDMLSEQSGHIYLSRKIGTKMKFTLIDDKGRSAYSKSGRKILKTLSFKKNKVFNIKVYSWK